MEQIYVGRQPILNNKEKIIAYELLFRDANKSFAAITDHEYATATVMANALHNIGFANLIGTKKGFINVNTDILASDFIELLPKENTVFEILENVEITEELIGLCKALKEQGYSFALDDFSYDDVYRPLFDIVDYVKFDLMASSKDEINEMAGILSQYPIKFLAEKVETKEEFEYFSNQGFQLFQGYFFAKPVIVSGKKISPSQLTLFQLFNSLTKEDDVDIIEKFFKRNPQLDFKLLNFINSAAFYLNQKINSIRQAIMLLGYRNLQKWITLMLFAKDTEDIKSDPLMERAAMRGLTMELLAKEIAKSRGIADSAFIVGILSLSEALLGLPMEELVSNLNLSQEIHDALIKKEGMLGSLLMIVEKSEQEEFGEVLDILQKYKLTAADFSVIQTNAILEYEHSGNTGKS